MSRTASEPPPGSLPGRRLATRAELFDPSRGYFDSAAIVVQPPETPELAEALDHALATWGATSI
ncbi:hypothetical protein CRT60_34275 [Azospirillum palustre]|uniref:Uncharacterized protein n=2 Tax=Azospirillum palustre TaxID=2044885 RepID=A0A2B8BBR0_9PROT|nr:hypothetical protein CRT60_34275 [Azospirillum palustre]